MIHPQDTDDLRSLAAWYLHDNHRLFWNLAIPLVGVLLILAFALADVAVNPAGDMVQNQFELILLAPEPVAEELNAAKEYDLAFEHRDMESSKAYYGKFGSYLPPVSSGIGFDSPELNNYVGKHRESIDLLLLGAEKPSANWNIDYSLGMAFKVPHLMRLREGARELSAYARVCSRQGKHHEAARALGAIYTMSRHVESDPILICNLVGVAMQSIADRTLAAILYFDTPISTETIAEYRRILRRDRDSVKKVIRTLECEQTMEEHMLHMISKGDWPFYMFESVGSVDEKFQNSPYVSQLAPLWYGSEKQGLEAGFDILLTHVKNDIRIDDSTLQSFFEQPWKGTRFYAKMMLPTLVRAPTAFQRTEAEGQALELALSLLSFRVRTGAYPSTLDELVPTDVVSLPLDPWNHKPWRLKSWNEGWKERVPGEKAVREHGTAHLRVYCLGQDGIDNDGRCCWIDDEGKSLDTNGPDDVFVRLTTNAIEEKASK